MTRSGRSLWTWTLRARASPATSTDLPIDLEVVPDRVDIERGRAVRLEQEHRLVAEALVGVGDERRGLGARRASEAEPRPPASGRRDGAAPPGRAGTGPAPGVDDARLAQDRRGGSASGRRTSPRRRPSRPARTQGLVCSAAATARVRRFADDGQDRALDGLGDRAVGGLGPRERAWARSRPLNRRFPSSPSAMPRKI